MARRCSSDKHSTGLISSELRATGHLSDRLISAVAAVSSVSYSALERSEISCYVQPRIRQSDSDTLRCSDSSCSVLVHMQTVRAMLMRKYRGIRSCYRCCREPVDPPQACRSDVSQCINAHVPNIYNFDTCPWPSPRLSAAAAD